MLRTAGGVYLGGTYAEYHHHCHFAAYCHWGVAHVGAQQQLGIRSLRWIRLDSSHCGGFSAYRPHLTFWHIRKWDEKISSLFIPIH